MGGCRTLSVGVEVQTSPLQQRLLDWVRSRKQGPTAVPPTQSQTHKSVFRELVELGRKRPSTDPNQNVRKEMGQENTRDVALNNESDPDRQAVTLEILIMTASGDQTDDLIE